MASSKPKPDPKGADRVFVNEAFILRVETAWCGHPEIIMSDGRRLHLYGTIDDAENRIGFDPLTPRMRRFFVRPRCVMETGAGDVIIADQERSARRAEKDRMQRARFWQLISLALLAFGFTYLLWLLGGVR